MRDAAVGVVAGPFTDVLPLSGDKGRLVQGGEVVVGKSEAREKRKKVKRQLFVHADR